MSRLKTNLKFIIFASIAICFAIAATVFLKTPFGLKVVNFYIENYPFIKFISSILVKNIGYCKEIIHDLAPKPILFDFSKLMLTALAKAFIFWCCSKIFLRTKYPSVDSHNLDLAEKEQKGAAYICIRLILLLASSTLGTIIVNELLLSITILIAGIINNLSEAIISFFIFIIVYLIYSIIYAIRDYKTFGFSLIKTAVFDIFPEAVSLFTVNLVSVAVLYSYITTGISFKTLISTIALFLCYLLTDVLSGWFRTFIIGVLKDNNSERRGLIYNLLWLCAGVCSTVILYSTNIAGSEDKNILMTAVERLPFMSGFHAKISIGAQIQDGSMGFLENVLILLVMSIILLILNNAILWFDTGILQNFILWGLQQGIVCVVIIILYAIYIYLTSMFTWTIWLFLILSIIALIYIMLIDRELFLNAVINTVCILCILLILESVFLSEISSSKEILLISVSVFMIFGFAVHCIRYRLSD